MNPKIIFLASKETQVEVTKSDASTSTIKSLWLSSLSERQYRSTTGISRTFLQMLSNRLAGKVTDGIGLSRHNKIELVFVILKQNLTFVTVSGMFFISDNYASVTFKSVLKLLVDELKNLVYWIDRGRINARMPKQFKAIHQNTRVIIDCSEIPAEKPASLRAQTLMYSHYKGGFTVKFLIGIAPSGEITFLSKAFGGRATDAEIVTRSDFLSYLEKGDTVLADKGFPRIFLSVKEQGSILVMPPEKSGFRQFSNEENMTGYNCSTVRIHVERAIARMKEFAILNHLRHNYFKHIDNIVMIIAAVCNCRNDLIKE